MKKIIPYLIFPIMILILVGLFFILINNIKHVNQIMGIILSGMTYLLLHLIAKKTIKL
jgi:hypothetical protein